MRFSAIALLALAPIAAVSAEEPGAVNVPFGLHVGLPQGPLADNANLAGGLNGGVTTTNAIFLANIGMQVGLPGPRFKPYLGGMTGFSAFSTTSSVTGSNSADEPFASSQNSGDVAFSQTVLGGLYIPLWSETALVDLGVRYT